MIYILLDEKKEEFLNIKGEIFKYLIKVRRHNEGDIIGIRYKNNISELCQYKIEKIENRSLELCLISCIKKDVKALKELHIGWCNIDTKSIEKVLPSLSEIGVSKISFINCDRSQKNFKHDLRRYERILEASMQQCGRSNYIEFDTYKNIQEFIIDFPDTKILDFSENILQDTSDIKTILIGCEGGFSQSEKEFLNSCTVFSLDTPMVLRSESAVMVVASKILL